MSTCEACGGDGLIEVGAYRGDADDTTTRECRLCGGVKSPEKKIAAFFEPMLAAKTTLAEVTMRDNRIEQPLVHRSLESGRRTVDLVIKPRAKTPQEVAAEYAARLNTDNERRQRESERKINSSVRCGREGHAWQLVRYVTGGKVVKCSDCDKMRHRKQ